MAWIDFLEKNAQLFNSKVAICDQGSGERLTYKELNERSSFVAATFQKMGLKKGDRLAFLATNRLEHILFLFACAKIGAIFVPLNFRQTSYELSRVLEKIDAKIFITNLFFDELSLFNPIALENFFVEKGVPFESEGELNDNDPVLMLFTSGSTGDAKGVLLHPKMLLTNQRATVKSWLITKEDSTIVETPFFHTGGINVLLLPLLFVGGRVFIASKFDIDNVFNCIEREKISLYFGVPTMFQMILNHPRFSVADFSSVRFFLSGGAACPVSVINAFFAKGVGIKQGFGLTEVGPNCFDLPEEFSLSKKGSIGRPMNHSDVLVVNGDGVVLSPYTSGELLIKGDHLFCGYYKDEKKYLESLFEGYFKTGDLVEFDEEGFFYVTGRIKDMYISGGENVFPGEVEKQILTYPSIDDVVVVSKKDEQWGEVGVAFVLSKEIISKDDLKSHLSSRLSRYKHPHEVICLESFPLLSNGKINRQELKNKV